MSQTPNPGARSSNLELDWAEVQTCPVCEHTHSAPFESLKEEGIAVAYRLCNNCGTVYQSPRMTDEALRAYYRADYIKEHQRAHGVTEKELRIQSGRARNLLRLARSHIATVDRHLDIGSSAGLLLEAFQSAYDASRSIGIEPAAIYRAFSAASGLTVYPDLDALAESGEAPFDLITMAHVLEHLPDPVGTLHELRVNWLKADGSLLVEVPNLFGHFSLERPHLLCFYPATLRRTLAEAGFRTLRLVRHGAPRSRLIPLYLTAIAEPAASKPMIATALRSSGRGVAFRRKAGMAWHRLATRLAPRWAWLPLPELESAR